MSLIACILSIMFSSSSTPSSAPSSHPPALFVAMFKPVISRSNSAASAPKPSSNPRSSDAVSTLAPSHSHASSASFSRSIPVFSYGRAPLLAQIRPLLFVRRAESPPKSFLSFLLCPFDSRFPFSSPSIHSQGPQSMQRFSHSSLVTSRLGLTVCCVPTASSRGSLVS